MNTIKLSKNTYTSIHAIPSSYKFIYNTDENKVKIAVVWKSRGYYFIKLYLKCENEHSELYDLRLVQDFTACSETEAKRLAERIVEWRS